MSIDIYGNSLGSRDATVSQITVVLETGERLVFEATGTSKRDPQDEDDPEVAVLLAYGRAFETLGKKMQKRANGLTKHNDDMKRYKEVQKAKKAKKEAKPKLNAARKMKVAVAAKK